MISESIIWVIVLLPALAAAINGIVIRWMPQEHFAGIRLTGPRSHLAGWLVVAAVALSFLLSLFTLISVVSDGTPSYQSHEWMSIAGLEITFGILLDPLTAIMLVVVSGVSLLVQIYGLGYMGHDDGYTRYFSYMGLFTASMLGLVTASNVVQLFVFWELVGISSYLLVGFWLNRPSAAAAAKKAFIVTRFGDFGFLLGIMYLYSQNPSWLDIETLYSAINAGLVATSVATWIGLGFFMGAVGKSAQFPLHTWLPDAMEGPTSVSALIHSATMVTAGVFLVARFFPLFEQSDIMTLVAVIGSVTAVFAATMALVADDIKRVLAYSTISQLGYMMFALGIGAYGAAIFHLFTHAFFKACLFLAAGSIHHAAGTFNMNYLGGLRSHMRITYISMLIASLSLAGIVPLSGFWSKDEILAHALHLETSLGWFTLAMGLLAALMTSFYMFRAIFKTFHGEFRGGGDQERADIEASGQSPPEGIEHVHLGESPPTMIYPIAILAVSAIAIGFLVNPIFDLGVIEKHAFSTFLVARNDAVFVDHDAEVHAGAEPEFDTLTALISTVVALVGIALAYVIYIQKSFTIHIKPVYNLLYRKYYFDELYENIVVGRAFYRFCVRSLDIIDVSGLDNVNVQIYRWIDRLGKGMAQIQNGQLQIYGMISIAGLLVALIAYMLLFA